MNVAKIKDQFPLEAELTKIPKKSEVCNKNEIKH